MIPDVFIDDCIDFGYEEAEAKYIPMLNEKDKELAEKDIEIAQLKAALKEALTGLPQ